MKKGRALIIIGLSLFLFGLGLVYQRYSPKKLEFREYSVSTISAKDNLPKEIIINNLKISLPIYPATIDGKTWQATDRGVSYLVSSPVPGEVGNSILYGHNWSSLLGRLPKIKVGDKIEIVMEDGTRKIFKVEYTSLVSSEDTQILAPSGDVRITLYTCAGFLDSKRFVVTAIATV